MAKVPDMIQETEVQEFGLFLGENATLFTPSFNEILQLVSISCLLTYNHF
jgi:hypothetical protein